MTTLAFAKSISAMSLKDKTNSLNKLTTAFETKTDPDGNKIEKESTLNALGQLKRWLTVNILIGNDLCPPESLNQY